MIKDERNVAPYLSTNNPITLLSMLMVTYLHTMVHVAVHLPTYIRISTMSISYLLTYLLKRPNFWSELVSWVRVEEKKSKQTVTSEGKG
jgi:hypothetical protein